MIDKLLKAKVDDAFRLCQKGPRFIGFLDPAAAADINEYLNRGFRGDYAFFGGYEGADRLIFGAFPDYLEPAGELFPLTAVTAVYRKDDKLSHRDFLGSFMSKGIERSTVGDILIEDGRCVFFVREELSDYFLQNVDKIGRVGVKLSLGYEGGLPQAHSFEEVDGVVASPRIDCMVAFLAGLSREKASAAIGLGNVFLNYRQCESVSDTVWEGDIISVRSKGKYVIDTLGPKTKKGRLAVRCRKFK